MTAHYLSHSTFPLKAGDTALVHAGAGGVGLLLTQMAVRLGARVITTVSTPAKAELSREAGASDVILYTEQDVETEIKRLTDGKGVDVVYDSVGKTTFEQSLNCLRPRGLVALFGASSGPVPPFDLIQLSGKGSLFVTRPRCGITWRRARNLNGALAKCWLGCQQGVESAHGASLSARRCGPGADRPGRPQDDRQDSPGAVKIRDQGQGLLIRPQIEAPCPIHFAGFTAKWVGRRNTLEGPDQKGQQNSESAG